MQSALDSTRVPSAGPGVGRDDGLPCGDRRTRDGGVLCRRHRAGETLGDTRPKALVCDQSRHLRTQGRTVGMPLRGCRAIHEIAAACRGIASQLARNGRGRTLEATRVLAHAEALSAMEGQLFSLLEREVTRGGSRRSRSQM